MDSVEVTEETVTGRGQFLMIVLACGAVAGFAAASAPAVFPPVAVAAAAGILIAAVAITAVVGLTGLTVLVPATFAFFLMNRFDEALAIHVGIYTIKASYWIAPAGLAMLAIMAVFRWEQAGALRTPLAYAPGWLMMAWTAFVALALASIARNALGDQYVPNRSALGEILALGSVSMPILFAALIPITPLSKQRTLWCIRYVTALAILTAFVMTVFAVLPQQVSGMLGWVKVLGSSGGLVRGSTPLGHANTVAGVLLLFLPLAIVTGVRHYSPFWTLYYLGGALLLMGGILFSLSRTALAVAVPVVGLCLLYLLATRAAQPAKTYAVTGVFAAGAIVVLAVLFSRFDFSRFWSREYYEDASVERRAQTMRVAMRVLRDYPLLGASPNSVYPRDEIQPDWVPPAMDPISPILFYRGELSAANAHNLFLNILAEYGVLGGGAFFAVLAAVALTLRRGLREVRGAMTFEHAMMVAMALALIAFLGAGLGAVLFLYSIRIGIVFWTLMGLAMRFCIVVTEERAEAIESRG